MADLFEQAELASLDILDFLRLILFIGVPPEHFLIKGFLNFKLEILVKFFAGLKLDRLVNVLAEFCRFSVLVSEEPSVEDTW